VASVKLVKFNYINLLYVIKMFFFLPPAPQSEGCCIIVGCSV